MKVIETVGEMKLLVDALKSAGGRIAFVPTMGFLHEGHLALVDEAKRRGGAVVVSIFVNPAQFGPSEDFEKYPRDMERDLRLCEERGVTVVFCPKREDLYPEGFQTYVNVEELTRGLCGAARPTHFRGVTTVCAKLFNIVRPDTAVFGEKDYQQLAVIRRMARDLDMNLEIVAHPTVREADGLAMSSRNKHLSPEERKQAPCLRASYLEAARRLEEGEGKVARLLEAARRVIEKQPDARIDYLGVYDAEDLTELDEVDRRAVYALAVFIGRTRLIDNGMLEP